MVKRHLRARHVLLPLLLVITCSAWGVDRTTAYLIDEEIERHIRDIIELRRFLHMNPELSQREFETSKLVASQLLSMGLEVKSGIAKTGGCATPVRTIFSPRSARKRLT